MPKNPPPPPPPCCYHYQDNNYCLYYCKYLLSLYLLLLKSNIAEQAVCHYCNNIYYNNKSALKRHTVICRRNPESKGFQSEQYKKDSVVASVEIFEMAKEDYRKKYLVQILKEEYKKGLANYKRLEKRHKKIHHQQQEPAVPNNNNNNNTARNEFSDSSSGW
jgi:hypothetical protein